MTALPTSGYTDKPFGSVFIAWCSIAALVNLTVLINFIYHKRYRKNYHMAFLNLAFIDLILALFGATLRGPSIFNGYKDEVMCRIMTSVSIIITNLNLLAVIPISYDRLIATKKPLSYNNRYHRRRIKISIALGWVATGIYYGLVRAYQKITGYELYEYHGDAHTCFFDDTYHRTWIYYVNVVMTRFAPLVFHVVVYTVVFVTMRVRRIRTSSLALIRSMLIVVTFTTSWLPGFIVNTIQLDPLKHVQVLKVTQFCFYINCLVDPVLYTFTSKVISRYRSSVVSKRNSIVRMRRSLSERVHKSVQSSIFSSSLVMKNEQANITPDIKVDQV